MEGQYSVNSLGFLGKYVGIFIFNWKEFWIKIKIWELVAMIIKTYDKENVTFSTNLEETKIL